MNKLNVQDVKKHLATKVRTMRIQQNLTQEELAVHSDVDVRSIQRVENHSESVSLKTIIHVAHGLNLTLSELFDESMDDEKK